jgi:hypothetical protein
MGRNCGLANAAPKHAPETLPATTGTGGLATVVAIGTAVGGIATTKTIADANG